MDETAANLDYANTREWLEKVTMQRNKALDERDALKGELAKQLQLGAEAFRDATKAALEDRGDTQKHELRAALAEIEKLRSEIVGNRQRIAELTDMHAQLYRELDAMMGRNRYLNEKNEELTKQQDALNQRIKRLKDWIDLLHKRAKSAWQESRGEAGEGSGMRRIVGGDNSDEG